MLDGVFMKKKSNESKQSVKGSLKSVEVTGRRKSVFILITILIPVVIILGTELILRFFGFGGYPDHIRRVGELPSGETLFIVEPASFKPYFFSNPDRPGYVDQACFVMPKPANTLRIFIVGESAAKGYPQPPNLAMGSFLEEMLSELLPEKKIEVISLAATAVASFPLRYIVNEAVEYDPDLFIFYTGNNEFFGAYGTSSINAAGILPQGILPLVRCAYGSAIVQAVSSLNTKTGADVTLMEEMIGQAVIEADASERIKAVENLENNLIEMASVVKEKGIPALICATAGNEAGLYPLGEPDWNGLPDNRKIYVSEIIKQAEDILKTDPEDAEYKLKKLLKEVPFHSGVYYLLAKAQFSLGKKKDAAENFRKAVKYDTMPWRPIPEMEKAAKRAAKKTSSIYCNIAEEFRKISSEGAAGSEFLDDHVHLSVRGQAEAARNMLKAIAGKTIKILPDTSGIYSLKSNEYYAEKLGHNIYDDYRVYHTMRVLFGIPFMKKTNPAKFAEFDSLVNNIETMVTPGIREIMHQWQTAVPHAGGLRPLTGMAARIMIREQRLDEARELFRIAETQVPEYTSWELEYVYFTLAINEIKNGTLSDEERNTALKTISKGKFMLANGYSESGMTERYLGRLHQLRGEWIESIPLLLQARPKLSAEDLVACDQALIMGYVKTGQKNAAIKIAEEGIAFGGKFSDIYKNLRQKIK